MESNRTYRIELLKAITNEIRTYYKIREGVNEKMCNSVLEITASHAKVFPTSDLSDKAKHLFEKMKSEIERALSLEGNKQYWSVRIADVQADLLSKLID